MNQPCCSPPLSGRFTPDAALRGRLEAETYTAALAESNAIVKVASKMQQILGVVNQIAQIQTTYSAAPHSAMDNIQAKEKVGELAKMITPIIQALEPLQKDIETTATVTRSKLGAIASATSG